MVRLSRAPSRIAGPPSRVAPAIKQVLPFYQSPEWRALVATVVRLRGRRCEDCGASGGKVYGDHVVELRDGGKALDQANVRLRCGRCHGRKTAQRRRERAGLGGPPGRSGSEVRG